MRRIWIPVLAAVAAGCGSASSAGYSAELSADVPKPRAEGPDFGAFQRTAPAPGGASAEAPKHLAKGR